MGGGEFDESLYNFYAVCGVDEIPEGDRLFIEVGIRTIVIFNHGGKFYAIADVCSHDQGPVGDGEIDGYEIICPRHGARFDIRNGKVTRLPAVEDIEAYPIQVVDGEVRIGVRK